MAVYIDVKQKEVERWLSTLYQNSSSVPEYEKTKTSIDLLYDLMSSVSSAESRAEILINDYETRAREYRAKGEEEAKILQNVHISKLTLSEPAQTALENIAMAANTVNADVPSESDVMIGFNILDEEHDKVMQHVIAKNKTRSQLIQLSQLIASKAESLNSLIEQATTSSSLEARSCKDHEKKEQFYEMKLKEYESEVNRMEAELTHRGYTSELSHSNICKEQEKLQSLKTEVQTLQRQLESYNLPPDMNQARLAVQQTRSELDSLYNVMVAELDS